MLNLTRRRRIRLKTFPNVSFLRQGKGLEVQEESLCASCGGQQKRKRYRNIQRTRLYCMELIQPETGVCTHIYQHLYAHIPIANVILGFHVASHDPYASGPATRTPMMLVRQGRTQGTRSHSLAGGPPALPAPGGPRMVARI